MQYPGHKGVALLLRSGPNNEVIVNGHIVSVSSLFEHSKRLAKRHARYHSTQVIIVKERRAFKLRGAH